MHFITILTLWAPIAMCALWNIQGTCGITNICVIDRARVDERKVCNGKPGKYAGSGHDGFESCTPPGTECTYVWEC
ncbi:hypothetical protein IWW34DRAFT_756413 [Fusarium oxysporum f. sp. albedinis]|nr:hypothetical protein IWW34DRAFT_756413 [Fusarium oxysporum f. sp. albedinis]KAK2469931.1 hypothetical protein H9L39_18746 [Fusarium oxysporum f. sp. albedinis]